jgi:hypothetical protein
MRKRCDETVTGLISDRMMMMMMMTNIYILKKSKSYPCNRLWRPIGVFDVKNLTYLDRESAHRWRRGCQPYAPAALYSPKTLFFCFWFSFLFRG